MDVIVSLLTLFLASIFFELLSKKNATEILFVLVFVIMALWSVSITLWCLPPTIQTKTTITNEYNGLKFTKPVTVEEKYTDYPWSVLRDKKEVIIKSDNF